MNIESYKKEFRAKALNLGYSEEIITKCISYAETLYNNKAPIIYNLTHLSNLTGYEKDFLLKASGYQIQFYKYYKIKKKNNGFRQICEPLPSLKQIQYWILNNILYKQKPSRFAKAYIPKKNIKENIRYHVNKKKVLSIDIKDFFPSITLEQVQNIFFEMGYSEYMSRKLAKLCYLEKIDGMELKGLTPGLPQGAPTSPYISNLIFKKMDDIISEYCKQNKIHFTRYADDLTFSSDDFDENVVLNFVEEVLNLNNFIINKEKIKIMLDNQRQIVTGLVINKKIQLDKKTRKDIRLELYYINQFGIDNHSKKRGIEKRKLLNYLIGITSYGVFLNSKDLILKNYLQQLSTISKELI